MKTRSPVSPVTSHTNFFVHWLRYTVYLTGHVAWLTLKWCVLIPFKWLFIISLALFIEIIKEFIAGNSDDTHHFDNNEVSRNPYEPDFFKNQFLFAKNGLIIGPEEQEFLEGK